MKPFHQWVNDMVIQYELGLTPPIVQESLNCDNHFDYLSGTTTELTVSSGGQGWVATGGMGELNCSKSSHQTEWQIRMKFADMVFPEKGYNPKWLTTFCVTPAGSLEMILGEKWAKLLTDFENPTQFSSYILFRHLVDIGQFDPKDQE